MRFRYSNPSQAQAWQEEADTLAQLCKAAGVHYGVWHLPEALLQGEALLTSPDLQEEALKAVAVPLQTLKQSFGYTTQDIVGLHPNTPNLKAMLAAFEKEHHHSDDEVRVILHGTGIFGLLPPKQSAFELELSAGDWIVLPAYTRHWFTLAEDKTALALRVFKSNPQWQAIYEPVVLAN
jgi:1,2-dihydroxy-3-keto-5-methylthiopentene dioxygenase